MADVAPQATDDTAMAATTLAALRPSGSAERSPLFSFWRLWRGWNWTGCAWGNRGGGGSFVGKQPWHNITTVSHFDAPALSEFLKSFVNPIYWNLVYTGVYKSEFFWEL